MCARCDVRNEICDVCWTQSGAAKILLEVDNNGAVNACNNWTVGGGTRHAKVEQHFLQEPKESDIFKIQWKSGEEMTSDLFTKNLGGPLFKKHASEFVGKDKCCCESKKRQSDCWKNNETSLPAIKQRFNGECSQIWNELVRD